ncbi:unnamed protein product [Coffea canephora]|uniref:DUF952 domain-containing protein n=1 Tax=Coffea canephora TaxID=49390 RepID=A0A068V8X7_COFCA|nr:unnamed protein product [Coffea canephora]
MAEIEKEKGWNSCKNTKKGGGGGGGGEQGFCNDYVYRISTAEEWAELQTSGSTFGRQIDKSTGCIHLSNLHQVQWVLHNFFLNSKGQDLFLLQIHAKKLGDGLVYEAAADDSSKVFPHFYGPSRSFGPLPLDVVTKAEKIILSDAKFTCCLLS